MPICISELSGFFIKLMAQYYIDAQYESLYLHVKDRLITKALSKRGYQWNFSNQTYSIPTGAFEDYLIVHRPSGRIFLQRNPSQTKDIIDFLRATDWNEIEEPFFSDKKHISFRGCKPSQSDKPITSTETVFLKDGYNWVMSYDEQEVKFILSEIDFLTSKTN